MYSDSKQAALVGIARTMVANARMLALVGNTSAAGAAGSPGFQPLGQQLELCKVGAGGRFRCHRSPPTLAGTTREVTHACRGNPVFQAAQEGLKYLLDAHRARPRTTGHRGAEVIAKLPRGRTDITPPNESGAGHCARRRYETQLR